KIQSCLAIHSQRPLSVKGKTLVVNSFALTTLWRVIWVIPPPRWFLTKVRRVTKTFIMRSKPAPASV
ncbi:hypothetical protein BC939DRAFT_402786, partial [Gamsiella multidivaricata]|uniref:uncharacterized protein n=1 Tax=Gamsiella multidivaricata TaxID=101098 RepID=UPI002220A7B0